MLTKIYDFVTGPLVSEMLVGIVMFVLGWLAKQATVRWRTRKRRRIWRPFLKQPPPIPVLLTDKDGANIGSPRKISVTDVKAYADIRSAFQEIGGEVSLKAGSSSQVSEIVNGAFIVLGGPKFNSVASHVMERLGRRLPISLDYADEGAPYFRYRDQELRTEYNGSKQVIRDFGLLVRICELDRDLTTRYPAILMFGLRGHGTQQVVDAVLNHVPLINDIIEHENEDYWALFSFDFHEHERTRREIISSGTIKN